MKWLWTFACTLANVCSDFIRRKRSIARSRLRNDRRLFSTLLLAQRPTSCLSAFPSSFILVANGRTAKFNTNEYVKLADPLGLRAFTVRFHPCPDIDPFTPFALWDEADPTNSLPWFSTYHGLKHNREHEFERASLANAFAAVAACAVPLVAQFGHKALAPDLKQFLSMEAPEWSVEEMYLMPQTDKGWTAQPQPALV